MTARLPEGDSPVERLRQRTMSAAEIFSWLAGYGMLPQLLRELVIDEAIAPFPCTFEETVSACKQFYEQHKIASDADRQAWLQQQGITLEQLEILATRPLRLEKFKQATWGTKVESYFLQRKTHLDKVVYSLVRVRNQELAQELFFRIQEGEQAFADLARQYSQGQEAQTGGLIGPAELSTPHPALAQVLLQSKPGQVSPPTRVGEWIVLVRLEQFMPAQLDDAMRQRLLNELFERWLQTKLSEGAIAPPSESPSEPPPAHPSPADTPSADRNGANPAHASDPTPEDAPEGLLTSAPGGMQANGLSISATAP